MHYFFKINNLVRIKRWQEEKAGETYALWIG